MSRLRLPRIFCALGVLSFAACGHAAPSTSGELLASGRSASDTVPADRAVATGKTKRPLPHDVLQDPAARVMRMQQLRRPIVQRIKGLPEARYQRVVRPDLARQLKQLGFDDQDVATFLTDLDRTRAAR